MIFLWEVLRRVFFNPFILLVLGVWLLLTMTPGGDWMLTEEERLGLEHFGQLERALSKFDDQGISTEVGAAQAYAHGCDMELNRETFAALMTQFQLDPDAFADGGTYRRSWLIGVERVATLLALDGGWAGRRSATCSIAIARYGADGTLVPFLLSNRR